VTPAAVATLAPRHAKRSSARTRRSALPQRVLLAGLGAANRAAARALTARGHTVTAFDDRGGRGVSAAAELLGIELVESPGDGDLRALVRGADMVVPTPGLPERHRAFGHAALLDRPVVGEFDLAEAWDRRPVAAVTGTSGKTTATEMTTAALRASGIAAVAAGNNDLPLVTAVDGDDAEVFVVEASSFRLAHSRRFTPAVGCWLNFAPDHLDVHRDLAAYEAAKSRIWRRRRAGAVAVANADDATVMKHVPSEGPVWTFSEVGPSVWHRCGRDLVGPDGPVMPVRELRRSRPHDVLNALAAAATAAAAGASEQGIREALSHYESGAHRLQRIAVIKGVEYYDDSKATTPHAALAALRSFGEAVLLAGGRNKGLDLTALTEEASRIRAVVAFGEAADEVIGAFTGVRPVTRAGDMDEAVRLAAEHAAPGVAVVLSPACASFDAYSGYAERGDDFAAAVSRLRRATR